MKLTIVAEKAGSKLEFDLHAGPLIVALFNPSKLTLSRSVQWKNQGAARRDSPEMQFTGCDAGTLGIDLFFDTYDTPSSRKDSVRKHTDQLRRLTTVEHHGDMHRPPVCQLYWGQQTMLFQGVLTQLETQYTLFLEDGTPVRATSRCTFKQWRRNVEDLQRQGLMSADVAKVWLVKQGQTLAAIAAREYGDPGAWRDIAQANGIDDPLAVRPGMQLNLPVRAAGWRRSA